MICETPTTISLCCFALFLTGFLGGALFTSKVLGGESLLTNRRLRAELTDERGRYLSQLQALQWKLERAVELRAGAEAQAAHFLAQRVELERHSHCPTWSAGCRCDVEQA